ncbi:hypothetical protein [Lysobacter sp.]|uniref:hypothetical protein n=1 Tax=Lysobacter sp. TaxID=72226 RepID=UPI002D70FD3A|nr:hypothetical protein [Lysobacter sp.]HZX77314.1 hypothetical protein [Lysobacter sp.]
MRVLNQAEVEAISGGAGVSGETVGCAIGGAIGGYLGGYIGGALGCIGGALVANNSSGWSVTGGKDIRVRYAVK